MQMDKASLIGDATAYMQELQKKATKLSEEISQLERRLQGEGGTGDDEFGVHLPQKETDREKKSGRHKMLQVQVARTTFLIRVLVNR